MVNRKVDRMVLIEVGRSGLSEVYTSVATCFGEKGALSAAHLGNGEAVKLVA